MLSHFMCCLRIQVYFFCWNWESTSRLSRTNALDLSSVQGMDLCFNGRNGKKKRTSWREPVFFQSDSVAVKFRAWIFNQNGFPVKDFFRLLSLHNKHNPCHCMIFTMNNYESLLEYLGDFALCWISLWAFTGEVSVCAQPLWWFLTFCLPRGH